MKKWTLAGLGFQMISTVVLLGGVSGSPADTANAPAAERQYRLSFYHTHTGERLDIVYRKGDRYIPSAIHLLEHYLRDHRTGAVHHYDPHVFDLLSDLTNAVGHPGGEIDVICGYRSPWSNEFLRHHSSGVAKHSLHMQAMAIDIRMPGVKTGDLRAAALALHRGGVGYYPASDFVHVDVGRVRQW
jgi:uncharacterized protein YcbK (DUF882 family)